MRDFTFSLLFTVMLDERKRGVERGKKSMKQKKNKTLQLKIFVEAGIKFLNVDVQNKNISKLIKSMKMKSIQDV